MFWLFVILGIAILTFGLDKVITGLRQMGQTTKQVIDKVDTAVPKAPAAEPTGTVDGSKETETAAGTPSGTTEAESRQVGGCQCTCAMNRKKNDQAGLMSRRYPTQRGGTAGTQFGGQTVAGGTIVGTVSDGSGPGEAAGLGGQVGPVGALGAATMLDSGGARLSGSPSQNNLAQPAGTTTTTPTAVQVATVSGTTNDPNQVNSTSTTGSGQVDPANPNLPLGAPVRSFVEFGDVAAAHPKDIWLDNVALTIPPSNVGITDIVFVDAGRPQQCYQKCKESPFCRFFSYWQETGSCNMHQTLQNGETTPENMIRYAYTVPFSQHWTSGHVRKSGGLIPPNQLSN